MMKTTKPAKAKTAAEQAEDRLVFDRPFTLLQYDSAGHEWTNAAHLHASVNKVISTGGQSPSDSAHSSRLIFRIRYYAALDDVRDRLQHYRISYGGNMYELADCDDYNERHSIIKLTASRIRTGTITLISAVSETKDTIGQLIPVETRTVIPCAEYEVTQDERTDAFQISLQLAFRLRVFRSEYSGERTAEYGSKRYCIGSVRYVGDAVDLYLGERIGAAASAAPVSVT